MGLKDDAAHESSSVINTVEIDKVQEDNSKNKTLLRMSTYGGGDINPNFERVRACILCLVMKLNLENLE